MDTDVILDGNKGESLSQYSIVKKLKGSYQSPRAEIVKPLPQLSTEPSDPLGPITPDSIHEGGDHVDECYSPDFSSLHWTRCLNSPIFGGQVYSNEGSPRTPEGLEFDPFAPGPDKLMLAPVYENYFTDSRTKVTRQLIVEEASSFNGNIDHSDNVKTVSEDEMLFELLYHSLLEVITSTQKEDLHSKGSTPLSDSDGYKTPTSAPHHTGVADTCPGTPMKPPNRYKTIDKGLCKKLIF